MRKHNTLLPYQLFTILGLHHLPNEVLDIVVHRGKAKPQNQTAIQEAIQKAEEKRLRKRARNIKNATSSKSYAV